VESSDDHTVIVTWALGWCAVACTSTIIDVDFGPAPSDCGGCGCGPAPSDFGGCGCGCTTVNVSPEDVPSRVTEMVGRSVL
jgi:hypothetical protein